MAIQVILQQVGPLPITINFNALADSPGILQVNGSIWSQTANIMIGIGIKLDGTVIGAAQIFSNGTATHRAVVPAYIPIQLSQGQHTLSLYGNTAPSVSDYNDFYTAVIFY
jgi:hypothetical protein